MVNINKIKELCKNHGIKQSFLCEQLGLKKVYFNDVAKRNGEMPDDRIRKIASMLGTTYEYLTDQSDDPNPPRLSQIAPTEEERLVHKLMELLPSLSAEQRDTISRLFSLPESEMNRALEMLRLFLN
nr:MAG TPA: ESX-1 secretion-associated regulator [Caudoviricetes sp.]